jgi:hypothetical protein
VRLPFLAKFVLTCARGKLAHWLVGFTVIMLFDGFGKMWVPSFLETEIEIRHIRRIENRLDRRQTRIKSARGGSALIR